jgi:phosphatidylserine/phosphatidylglycerophosphate/cardiolipin synthase-like enzyme
MRNRKEKNGLELTVVTGTYVALLSIRITDTKKVNKKDFLGFEIKRDDLTEKESYPLRGFKYFPETAIKFDPGQLFDTDKQPVQSFFWEDFSVKYEHKYIYHIIPVYGKPKNLQYGGEVAVEIESEKKEGVLHSVYFNMGVSGSLAYAGRFHNKRPDQMTEKEKADARKWLSRGLEEALLGFIDKAIKNKFGLRIAFYEFTYAPVLEKLQEAVSKGCDVQIVYDSRDEEAENDEAIKNAGLKRTIVRSGKKINVLTRRTKDPQVPSHNKFMILMDGDNPIEVWTGSTNITDKGVLGHSNVGHILRNKSVAQKYFAYWGELHKDPEIENFKPKVATIQNDIEDIDKFTDDITVFFSPRPDKEILKTYAKFIDSAEQMVCGIFPFSFSKEMKAALAQKTDHLKYILVDKIGNANGIVKKDDNTIIVNGAYFAKAMFDWLEEINSGILLNKKPNPTIGTNYVHNKVLLIDPLSGTPVVIMGSANFSDPSIASNDENTLVIKGGKDLRRICDIYFTEFYRIFHHFFVRKATQEINKGQSTEVDSKNNPIHLKQNNEWVTQFNKDGVKVLMQKQLAAMPLDF